MFLWSIDGLYLCIIKWKQRELRLQGLFVNFCFQAILKIRRDGEGLESREPLTSLPSHTSIFVFEGTLTCRPVVIVTQHFVTEIRETKRSLSVNFCLNQGERQRQTLYSALSHHVSTLLQVDIGFKISRIVLTGASYQQTMSISFCSVELLIHMNDECFPNTRYFIFSYPKSFVSVTQNLKTREQFRRVTLWGLLLFSRVPCGYNSVTSVWHLKQNIACMRDVLKT